MFNICSEKNQKRGQRMVAKQESENFFQEKPNGPTQAGPLNSLFPPNQAQLKQQSQPI